MWEHLGNTTQESVDSIKCLLYVLIITHLHLVVTCQHRREPPIMNRLGLNINYACCYCFIFIVNIAGGLFPSPVFRYKRRIGLLSAYIRITYGQPRMSGHTRMISYLIDEVM